MSSWMRMLKRFVVLIVFLKSAEYTYATIEVHSYCTFVSIEVCCKHGCTIRKVSFLLLLHGALRYVFKMPVSSQMLLQIADDFIESVVTAACQLARHRKSNTLEVKDVQLHLGKQMVAFVFLQSVL